MNDAQTEIDGIEEEADALLAEIEGLKREGLNLDEFLGAPEIAGDAALPAGYTAGKLQELESSLDTHLPDYWQAVRNVDEQRPEVIMAALMVLQARLTDVLAARYTRRAGAIEDAAAYLAEEWIARQAEADDAAAEQQAAAVAQTVNVPIGGDDGSDSQG